MSKAKKTFLTALFLTASNIINDGSFAMVDIDLEKEARNSRRSMVLYVENKSDQIMVRNSLKKDHGEWVREPAEVIQPGQTIAFANVSNGILTGCEGEVAYLCVPGMAKAIIHWSNPFVGSSSTQYTLANPGGRSLVETGTGGDVLRYYFR